MTTQSSDSRTGERVTKTDAQWREELTREQYDVLRRAGTERAGTGEYAYSKDPGTYRCAACDAELFASDTKYDSGTGWPSFTQPLTEDAVEHVQERGFLGSSQTEVRCRSCASHLGHVFPDGPRPTGQRYCMNSVALKLDPAPSPA
ncbi:MAG: peptide-methionine (R)-S-oxide reductase MsrB [Actinobacteria bacterium]|nr:peptide-methionine (R)-S-oxide reductase MsrB [Actinomycetota bacterium]